MPFFCNLRLPSSSFICMASTSSVWKNPVATFAASANERFCALAGSPMNSNANTEAVNRFLIILGFEYCLFFVLFS